jgi:hypothetical protein
MPHGIPAIRKGKFRETGSAAIIPGRKNPSKNLSFPKNNTGDMRYLLLTALLAAMLIAGGCVNKPHAVEVITVQPVSPAITTPATISALPDQDPIVGRWQNGMVFSANGSAGDDGKTTWHPNGNVQNSYFIIHDEPSELDRARNITATEWIYVPASDCIHRRGSPVLVYRQAA